METTIATAFKDCKVVLKPFIVEHYHVSEIYNIDVYMPDTFLRNPAAMWYIKANWDKFHTHKGILQYLLSLLYNPNSYILYDKLISHINALPIDNRNKLFKHLKDEQPHSPLLKKYYKPLYNNSTHSCHDLCMMSRYDEALQMIQSSPKSDVEYLIGHIFNNYNIDPNIIEKHWEVISRYGRLIPNYWYSLCANPATVSVIEHHWDWLREYNFLHWLELMANPNAVYLIDKYWNIARFVTGLFGLFNNTNPDAIILIEKHWEWIVTNINKETYMQILSNPNAGTFVKSRLPWFIEHNALCADYLFKNPAAVSYIEQYWNTIVNNNCLNPHTIAILCENPNAVNLIDTHWDALFGGMFDPDFNDREQICTKYYQLCDLCQNPNALWLIEKHWDDIEEFVYTLAEPIMYDRANNPYHGTFEMNLYARLDIFDDEYHAVAKKWVRGPLTEELMSKVWHPRNITRFRDWGIDPDA